MRLLHVDFQRAACRDALAEEGGGDAEAMPLADSVAHGVDGERYAAFMRLRRGRDRVEARLQRIERLDESFRVRPDAGEFLDRGEDVERCRIAVGVFAGAERLGFEPPLAAGEV